MNKNKVVAYQQSGVSSDRQAVSKVRTYLQAALAKNTQKAYQKDLAHFVKWGGTIPATPECVACYLAYLAPTSAIATVSRHLVSIGRAHTIQSLASPTKSELVRLTLRGIRRINGSAQRQVAPALKEDIQLMVKGLCGIKGVRDRALLLIGFAGAFRRSELVSLQVEDIQFVAEGLIIHLRRGKTDQEGRGRDIAIPFVGGKYCPASAIRDWLVQSGIKAGKIFRQVSRYGYVMNHGISAQSVALIVKAQAAVAGLNPQRYSGHSLRVGLVTSAAKAGVSSWKIRQQTGHQSDAMLQRYIRDTELFIDNPVGKIW